MNFVIFSFVFFFIFYYNQICVKKGEIITITDRIDFFENWVKAIVRIKIVVRYITRGTKAGATPRKN